MKEKYDMEPHGPWIVSGGKRWCFSCGLVDLKNSASEWCVEKGCLYDLHPNYEKKMKKLAGKGKWV